MIDDKLLCLDSNPTLFGIFDLAIAPTLLYYSYVPITIVSLVLGIYILFKSKFSLTGKLFFLTTLSLALWILSQMIQWIAAPAPWVHFAWQIITLPELGIVFFSAYFLHVFLHNRDLPYWQKITLFVALIPVFILTPTIYNHDHFDLVQCEPSTEILWTYIYILEIITIFWVINIGISYLRNIAQTRTERMRGTLITLGTFIMLVLFTSTNVLGEATLLYEINLIGPLGVVIFLSLFSYLIVRYKEFNIKTVGAQVLVIILLILIGSILFIRRIENARYVAIGTIGVVSVIGYALVRGVKKEVKQREEIEKLADNLKKVNARLDRLNKEKTEFISLATHQIRAPLSAIKGYASMMLEGDFGPISDETKDAVSTMYTSAHNLVSIVGDYLDISRLDLNRLKFNLDTFDVSEAIDAIVREQQPNLRGKELSLTYAKADTMPDKVSIKADAGKIKQAIGNLIDNAIKYTPKGSVTVTLGRAETMLGYRIMISDTGVGIPAETLPKLFKRFSRADDAHTVNVQGTGLGLYLVRKMIETHGGKVWAESDGKDKGSRFIIELPIEAKIKEGILAEGEEGELR